jgi:hypothetical protein
MGSPVSESILISVALWSFSGFSGMVTPLIFLRNLGYFQFFVIECKFCQTIGVLIGIVLCPPD